MLDRVAKTITRYNMFRPGERVGVAVSGGADSVCLLHLLHELGLRLDVRLTVVHLDHQLRGDESTADCAFVKDLAAELELPFECRREDIAARRAQSGENLEEAGRTARRAFFRELLANGMLDRIATGHTRSDQAETVLFRLLRGAGSAGL